VKRKHQSDRPDEPQKLGSAQYQTLEYAQWCLNQVKRNGC
jgi:hypothetical protein